MRGGLHRGNELATRVLRMLAACPGGLSRNQLATGAGNSSKVAIQRCLTDLEHNDFVELNRSTQVWTLVDPDYELYLNTPEAAQLQAILMAEAVLGAVVDEPLRRHLRRAAKRLDERARMPHNETDEAAPRTRVDVSFSSHTHVRPELLHALLRALRREVVQVSMSRPRTSEGRELLLIEPWALRMHDTAWYVRAFDRKHNQPITFAVTNVHRVSASSDFGEPLQPVPTADVLWADGDPMLGLDHDRPATARVVLRNPVARRLYHELWHPNQDDAWVDADTLARTVPYTSCREFARTLRAYADGVVSVEPEELRVEMLAPFRDALD